MENTFRVEFYPTDKDIQDVWEDSLIVFDTCSLLNLYRYSKRTREDYLSVLKKLEDRLWLPYQVGKEFFSNRIPTIISIGISYDKISQMVDKQFDDIKNAINEEFKFHEDDIKSLIEEIDSGFKKIKSAISNSKKSRIPFSFNTDPILDDLKRVYKNKVGVDFTVERMSEISKEGETRFENKVPPGYCDRNKDNVKKNKFGDLILWKQIIEKSLNDKKNIIFITDDSKEDWWLKIHGRTISPRKELYAEFLQETQRKILIYRPNIFMKYVKDRLSYRLNEGTINEIENISTFFSRYIKQGKSYNSDFLKLVDRLKSLYSLNSQTDSKYTLDDFIFLANQKRNSNDNIHPEQEENDDDLLKKLNLLVAVQKLEDCLKYRERKKDERDDSQGDTSQNDESNKE